jgi:hypothetical protein
MISVQILSGAAEAIAVIVGLSVIIVAAIAGAGVLFDREARARKAHRTVASRRAAEAKAGPDSLVVR